MKMTIELRRTPAGKWYVYESPEVDIIQDSGSTCNKITAVEFKRQLLQLVENFHNEVER